jgi:hypothetical protein
MMEFCRQGCSQYTLCIVTAAPRRRTLQTSRSRLLRDRLIDGLFGSTIVEPKIMGIVPPNDDASIEQRRLGNWDKNIPVRSG